MDVSNQHSSAELGIQGKIIKKRTLHMFTILKDYVIGLYYLKFYLIKDKYSFDNNLSQIVYRNTTIKSIV